MGEFEEPQPDRLPESTVSYEVSSWTSGFESFHPDDITECHACKPCGHARWSLSQEAVFLNREESLRKGFIVRCLCDPAGLSPHDVELDLAAGLRTSLRRHFCTGYEWDITYLGAFHWDEEATFTGPALAVFEQVVGPGTAVLQYESELHSLESNVWFPWTCWGKVLLGFRWLTLDEIFNVRVNADCGCDADAQVRTDNDLLGLQTGFSRCIYDDGGCFQLNTEVKAGVYGNFVDKRSRGLCDCDDGKDETLAFLGEVVLRADYQLTRDLFATAAYNVLWLDGVALAADQLPPPTGEPTDVSSLVLHGASVGLRLVW